MRILTLVLATSLVGGCAWVKLEPGAGAVRIASTTEDLSHCERAGDIAVSVRDRVGFYDRDDLKVRDELETLARNEAGSLRADTLQALGPPVSGEQRFAGFRCGAAVARTGAVTRDAPHEPAPAARESAEPRRTSQGFEAVETFPLEGNERP